MEEKEILCVHNKFVNDFILFDKKYYTMKNNYTKMKNNNFTNDFIKIIKFTDYNIETYSKMINTFHYNCNLLKDNITKSDKKNKWINNSFKNIESAYKSNKKKIKNKKKYTITFNYELIVNYREVVKSYEYILRLLYPGLMSEICG